LRFKDHFDKLLVLLLGTKFTHKQEYCKCTDPLATGLKFFKRMFVCWVLTPMKKREKIDAPKEFNFLTKRIIKSS